MAESTLLEKNIEAIYPSKKALSAKLRSGKMLKIYLGIDPTSPEIHIGNAIALWKLKEFQKLGHVVILLIGDFTGMIGDPSDKTAMRKKMSREEVLENTRGYKKQASKILDFTGKNPAKLEFNSDWLSKLSLEDLIELAGNFTVQQLIERDMFQKRISEERPIGLHEFLYPLLQGYDSVVMDIDIEIGGTDQTFNMLVGRTLVKKIKNKEKFVITLPLLPGPDRRKMSKSYDNTIGITEKPNQIFGKVMSLKDELIIKYFNLCTEFPKEKIEKIATQLQMRAINPMEVKKKLAFEVVKSYHGEKSAEKAQKEFTLVFQKGGRTRDIEVVEKPISILPKSYASLATIVKATPSVSEAVRLVKNKGLKFDGKLISEPRKKLTKPKSNQTIIDVGKRKSVKIIWRF